MLSTTGARSTAGQEVPALQRLRLSPTASFAVASAAFASLYLAAGAPTPLLVLFQHEWRFPSWVLTVAFAAYALGLLAALLVTGSLSDYLGRKPVLVASLAVELAAMVMFVFAPSIGWVIAARTIQGVATGAATSAFTAAIVELAPARFARLGSIIGSAAPAGGLGLGALLTGVAVQFTSAPSRIAFTALAGIMAVAAVVTVFSTETVTPRPGGARSLVPRVLLPPAARHEFAAAVPVQLAAWMLAGLFLGLMPTIIRDVLHRDSGLLDGITVFIEPGTAAVAGILLGRLTSRRTVLVGGICVLAGTVLVLSGVIAASLPLLWIGGIVGGVGFGASVSGSLRILGPLAHLDQRAGLFAAVFLVAYLAFGVPAILAGVLISPVGLLAVVVGYSAVTIAAASVGLIVQARQRPPA